MPLSLKHPTTQELPRKLPREFVGQWQEILDTPDFRFVKEVAILEDGKVQTISGMAELTHKTKAEGQPRVSLFYYPTFSLREDRPRRMKAWFELATTVEGHCTIERAGKPETFTFRTPGVSRTILRFKIDGTRLKIGTAEGEFSSEGLHFHVAQTHDLVGGYKRIA